MEKSKQEPTVPPKHVRRAEFYKRLRENCNDSQKQEKTILEEFKEIAKLSKEVDEKAIVIESPNNQKYEELVMKSELETKRHPLIIDNDKLYGR